MRNRKIFSKNKVGKKPSKNQRQVRTVYFIAFDSKRAEKIIVLYSFKRHAPKPMSVQDEQIGARVPLNAHNDIVP